ncbi:lipase secretion chaperone [Cupriavidus sp. DL-D2]|uniref:lipase secretion chaperone n=1 Tax=Cupriavidus sp. DL-D2 TaxID=3144974 RepID=UPI0032160102
MTGSESRAGVALVLLVGGLAGAAVYWATLPAEPATRSPLARSSMDAVSDISVPLADTARMPAIGAMPSLAGVDIPPGPESDARGNLRLTRALRTYFDFFLSARHASGDTQALDRLVYDDIRKHVPQPAAGQAMQLWQRYLAYLAEMQRIPANQSVVDGTGAPDAAQIQRLRAHIADRSAVQWRHLPDVASIWFGDEQTYDDAMLARLEVAIQSGLDDAERKRRLAALDAALPEPLRAAREMNARPQAITETIASMKASGHGAQEIGAALAQAFSPEVAQRYQLQAQADHAWQQRYDEYATRRTHIETVAGLSDQDRAQQLATLRQQAFSLPSEALQAEVMDKAAAAKRAEGP